MQQVQREWIGSTNLWQCGFYPCPTQQQCASRAISPAGKIWLRYKQSARHARHGDIASDQQSMQDMVTVHVAHGHSL
eukprot:1161945-Pelagomonas_calceolata.AAC.6